MNALNIALTNKFVTSSLCFAGGYSLNSISLSINRLAVKYLKLPIDIHNHQEYDEYTNNCVEANRRVANLLGIGLNRQLGTALSDFTIFGIREEISYRFLLEKIVLPHIFPQFAVFSFARTCVSSLFFAAAHLQNDAPSEPLAGQFFHTAILGMVCSLALERIGLVGSVFVHIGFNLYAWQHMLNENLTGVVEKIKAIHLVDVINPAKFLMLLGGFIGDATFPATLAYRATKKIASSFA
ncbi:MAG: CPBP family intramembrane metalloprotease [Chlamydiota bacterium]|jgi:hypothetical protein